MLLASESFFDDFLSCLRRGFLVPCDEVTATTKYERIDVVQFSSLMSYSSPRSEPRKRHSATPASASTIGTPESAKALQRSLRTPGAHQVATYYLGTPAGSQSGGAADGLAGSPLPDDHSLNGSRSGVDLGMGCLCADFQSGLGKFLGAEIEFIRGDDAQILSPEATPVSSPEAAGYTPRTEQHSFQQQQRSPRRSKCCSQGCSCKVWHLIIFTLLFTQAVWIWRTSCCHAEEEGEKSVEKKSTWRPENVTKARATLEIRITDQMKKTEDRIEDKIDSTSRADNTIPGLKFYQIYLLL